MQICRRSGRAADWLEQWLCSHFQCAKFQDMCTADGASHQQRASRRVRQNTRTGLGRLAACFLDSMATMQLPPPAMVCAMNIGCSSNRSCWTNSGLAATLTRKRMALGKNLGSVERFYDISEARQSRIQSSLNPLRFALANCNVSIKRQI